jgi:hypothetical protein
MPRRQQQTIHPVGYPEADECSSNKQMLWSSPAAKMLQKYPSNAPSMQPVITQDFSGCAHNRNVPLSLSSLSWLGSAWLGLARWIVNMKKSVRIVMLGLLALGASEVACGFMMAATPTPAATTAASTAAAGGPTMSISRKQFFGAAAALTAGVAVVRPVGPALADPIPTVGNEAPDFKLPSNTGTDLSLSDLIAGGSTLVLYFYPGDFTQGCTIEANAFQKDVAAGKYKELNARVVGVSGKTWI